MIRSSMSQNVRALCEIVESLVIQMGTECEESTTHSVWLKTQDTALVVSSSRSIRSVGASGLALAVAVEVAGKKKKGISNVRRYAAFIAYVFDSTSASRQPSRAYSGRPR